MGTTGLCGDLVGSSSTSSSEELSALWGFDIMDDGLKASRFERSAQRHDTGKERDRYVIGRVAGGQGCDGPH